MTESILTTANGMLRGTRQGSVHRFLNIPYAKPPFAGLRFEAPERATPWTGTRDATQFGAVVPQSQAAYSTHGFPAWNGEVDVLTVNIWTPDPSATLPVMVFVHGGAFRGGSANNPTFNSTTISAEQNVVLVTVNYRNGFEGWGYVPGAPMNRGLRDVALALQWVRDSIADFGGDPGNVTLFGHSAGANVITALAASPVAANLFDRLIAQSPAGTYFSEALTKEISRVIVDRANVSGPDLRSADPQVLADAGEAVTSDLRRYGAEWPVLSQSIVVYSPMVGDEFLPEAPWTALARPDASSIPMIFGHATNEYRAFALGRNAASPITREDAALALSTLPDPAMTSLYEDLLREQGVHSDSFSLYETVHGDWLFNVPTISYALARGDMHPTYVYMYDYASDAANGILGAAHGAELPLLFDSPNSPMTPTYYQVPFSDEALRIGRELREAWSAMAYRGDPGWEAFRSGENMAHVFATASWTESYRFLDRAQIFPSRVIDTISVSA